MGPNVQCFIGPPESALQTLPRTEKCPVTASDVRVPLQERRQLFEVNQRGSHFLLEAVYLAASTGDHMRSIRRWNNNNGLLSAARVTGRVTSLFDVRSSHFPDIPVIRDSRSGCISFLSVFYFFHTAALPTPGDNALDLQPISAISPLFLSYFISVHFILE